MGNLFLREKEKWLTWSLWGFVGAVITLYTAFSTQTPLLIAVSSIAIVIILTWWMHSTRRFDFGRAFKVCCYVSVISILPAFLLVLVPSDELNRFDLIFQSLSFITFSLLVCLLCSWIAKRPKQYY